MLPGQIGHVRPGPAIGEIRPGHLGQRVLDRGSARVSASASACSGNRDRDRAALSPDAAGRRAGTRRSCSAPRDDWDRLRPDPLAQAAGAGYARRLSRTRPLRSIPPRRRGRVSFARTGIARSRAPPIASEFGNSARYESIASRTAKAANRGGRAAVSRCGATPRVIRKAGFPPSPFREETHALRDQGRAGRRRVSPLLALVAGAAPAQAAFGAFAYDEATGKYGASWNQAEREAGRGGRSEGLRRPTNARSSFAPPPASAARSPRPRTARPGAARSGRSARTPKKPPLANCEKRATAPPASAR